MKKHREFDNALEAGQFLLHLQVQVTMAEDGGRQPARNIRVVVDWEDDAIVDVPALLAGSRRARLLGS